MILWIVNDDKWKEMMRAIDIFDRLIGANHMEIRELQTFKKVVEMKHFTRAAEALGYAQSTVTSHIGNLESSLGIRLFDRIGRQIQVTEEGRALYQMTQEMFSIYDRMLKISEMHDGTRGKIILGVDEPVALYRLKDHFKRYKEMYPDVEIILRNAVTRELQQMLLTGEIDLLIIFDRLADTERMNRITLVEEEMVFVGSPAYIEKRDRSEDVNKVIQMRRGSTLRALFEAFLIREKKAYASSIEAWSIEMVKQMVNMQMGIALLPKVAVEAEIEAGELEAEDLVLEGVDRIFTQILYHREKTLTMVEKEFISFIQRSFESDKES
jgi:DNA-binding transcriptional LysR family regulator